MSKPAAFEYLENAIWLKNDADVCTAKLEYFKVNDQLVDIHHTYVDSSLRGQGVADQLMQAACEKMEERGLRIIPSCSYAAKWMDEHPEYQHLRAKKEASE